MATIAIDLARAERERQVEDAQATLRLEGLEIPAEAKDIFERYVDGELTIEQMSDAIDEFADLKYGSVRLSRE